MDPLVNSHILQWKDPPFFMGKSTINGEHSHSNGKIHHFSWEKNPLFRLGHFPLLCECSPEGNCGARLDTPKLANTAISSGQILLATFGYWMTWKNLPNDRNSDDTWYVIAFLNQESWRRTIQRSPNIRIHHSNGFPKLIITYHQFL